MWFFSCLFLYSCFYYLRRSHMHTWYHFYPPFSLFPTQLQVFFSYYLFVSLQPTGSSFFCSCEHIKSCPVEPGKPSNSLTSVENWLFISKELSAADSSLVPSRVSWDLSPFMLVCSCARLVQVVTTVVCSWVPAPYHYKGWFFTVVLWPFKYSYPYLHRSRSLWHSMI